ncbi:hypothetical protein FB45DRAFT_862279 [Roridomyces roridus]|uniref:Uncharacterized protein n=1 Tax=Roridomyces roridus TaxID=1738132 RepID=A0AAD7C6P8_9AGAR|nr:hypothetical protein FB45DRAFT_862279 [Roridomyces roridus]
MAKSTALSLIPLIFFILAAQKTQDCNVKANESTPAAAQESFDSFVKNCAELGNTVHNITVAGSFTNGAAGPESSTSTPGTASQPGTGFASAEIKPMRVAAVGYSEYGLVPNTLGLGETNGKTITISSHLHQIL